MRVDRLQDRIGQRNVSDLASLGQAKHLLVTDQLDLATNVHLTTVDVDVLGGEPEGLALPHAESGTETDHQLVARRQLVSDGEPPGPGV